ncbi:MAG: tetratricopeptide repeat protein [Prevotellaceae bacterium]|jgi:tetratricopeptide (TPR) repeat protein|nr:tetratricopeptide repeat protein [Prevotellaceae bacterium]
MKKAILILFSVILVFSVSAQNKMVEANALYLAEKYEEAAAAYTEILQSGKESATLYYNLGNACYKQNKIAPAILNYERALRLKPNDENTRHNLELARARTVDNIETLNPFFLKIWITNVSNLLSSNAWAVMSIVAFILFITAAFFYFFGRYRLVRKIAFGKACILLLLSISSFCFAKMQKDNIERRDYAIVFSENVTAKGSPDESGTNLFVLHAGTKLRIKSAFGNGLWLEIQLEDGNTGWVKATTVEII